MIDVELSSSALRLVPIERVLLKYCNDIGAPPSLQEDSMLGLRHEMDFVCWRLLTEQPCFDT
ncbi:hypothetical protein WS65_10680 [Burkholderia anthina]|nr:hypothetical protein WS65_10680 [Burkholderia anthina]